MEVQNHQHTGTAEAWGSLPVEGKLSRYNRQMMLAEIGEEGQARLARARVLIVGVGGLGSPAALYLAGAGVGHIGLVDSDLVSCDNLHRQVLYTEEDVQQPKALCAARRLRALNNDVDVTAHVARLEPENARRLIEAYDIVLDGCDNYETRYLMDEVCAELRRPYIYGAITPWTGQVSVFTYQEGSFRYRDLYPPSKIPDVPASKAVLGTVPGLVSMVQATEVLKLVCQAGSALIGRLWTIDLRTMQTDVFSLG